MEKNSKKIEQVQTSFCNFNNKLKIRKEINIFYLVL